MRRELANWFGPLFWAVLIGAGVGGVRHFTRPPLHEARVEVQPPSEAAFATANSNSPADGDVDDPEELVFSPAVLSAAAQRLRHRQIDPFDRLTPQAAAEELAAALRLAMRSDSPNIVVACTTADRDQAMIWLQAWTDAWLETHCGPDQPTQQPAAKPVDEATISVRTADLRAERNTQQQTVASLEKQLGGPAGEVTRDLVQQEKLKSLVAAVATATARRLEAENRYVQIRRDVESGIAMNLILPRLPDGTAKHLVEEMLKLSRLEAEETQLRAERNRLSKVYGLNHPRIVELDNRLAESDQIGPFNSRRLPLALKDADQLSPTQLLLESLAADLAEQKAVEKDVQSQLELERDMQEQRATVVVQLRDAMKRTTELQSQLDKLTAPPSAPATKSVLARSFTAVVRPPELLPKPVRSVRLSLIESTATAFVAWLSFLGLVTLRERRIRAAVPAQIATRVATIRPTPLRERRDERMLRLRLNRLRTPS
ncbi:MAG: hypothetical protein HZA46_03175 [Planctomycetales bacterium]|nr:hypothetical protein [Planctomycetales bacterium]